MLPVTAFSFILAKLIPHVYGADKLPIYYWAYFIVWLMVSLFFILKKDNAFTNRMTLISGGVIGVFIPIVNGVMTDSWIWDSLFTNHDFFVVDTLWLVIGSLSLFYGLKLSIKSKQVMSTLSVKEESKLQIL